MGIMGQASDLNNNTNNTMSAPSMNKAVMEMSALPDTTEHDPYYYSLFTHISELYLENHLYDFDEATLYKETLLKLFDNNPDAFYSVIKTMLSTMDRFSNIYSPTSDFLSLDSLGYGITLQDVSEEKALEKNIPEGIYIESVLPDSSAFRAGVKPNDRIKSVLGIDLEGIDFSGATSLIRNSTEIMILQDKLAGTKSKGDKVSECKFIVSRLNPDNGIYEDVEINMGVSTVEFSELATQVNKDEGVAVISIASFIGETLPLEFKETINSLYNDGYKKITIDLRGNTGGIVDIAIEMANMLIPEEGKILYYINSRELNEPTPVYSVGGGIKFDNINVLINGKTASAAELFTLIMRETNDAKIIGKTSVGKFLGQKTFRFMTGDTVSITSFEILGSDLRKYDKIGIVPDYDTPILREKYVLEALPWFNHTNYKTILPGVESEVTLGLEKRLSILGILKQSRVDGIYDAVTENAIKIFQALADLPITGMMDDNFVTAMTENINTYKNLYINIDTQLDVAMMCHKNNSQGKRLAAEYRNEQAKVDAEKAARDEMFRLEYEAELEKEKEVIRENKKAEKEKQAAETQEQITQSTP